MTTRVDVVGGSLHVDRTGDDGPTALFLHYWGGSARTWDAVVGRLPSGWRSARYDQRGWGRGRNLAGPCGLHALADDAERVLDALGDDVVLVGHSMGGKVSQLVAARRSVRRVVLVAPAPATPPPSITPEYQRQLARAYDDETTIRTAVGQMLTASPLPASTVERIVADSLDTEPPARDQWPLHGIAEDITAATRSTGAPVTVLAGERDRVEPIEVLRAHLLPYLPAPESTRITVVAGAGHLLPLEAPDAVADAVLDR